MTEWQPIETAPQDVEWINTILVSRARGKRATMPAVFDGERWMAVTIARLIPYSDPTHWMPLPEPPEQQP